MNSMATLLCGVAGALLAVAAQAASGDNPSHKQQRETRESILMYVEHKQCDKAIKVMNEGLAKRMDNVMLMAGTMYEEGICLKKNWDQAAKYYQMASEAGNRAALPRHIAGLAFQHRDPAAALWWAAEYGKMPLPCRAADGLRDNPDAFVAAIKAWPQERLATCVYVAGVIHRVAGDMEFPGQAIVMGLNADIVMRFDPETGKITWTKANTEFVSVTRSVLGGDEEGAIYKSAFAKPLVQMGERVLSQFQRPPSIAPFMQVTIKFVFTLDLAP